MSPSDQIVPLVVALIVLSFIIVGAGFGMLYYALRISERFEEIISAYKADMHAEETVKVEAPQIDFQAVAALKHTRPQLTAFQWPALQPTVKRKIATRNLEG
jgi:hypothetical protein